MSTRARLLSGLLISCLAACASSRNRDPSTTAALTESGGGPQRTTAGGGRVFRGVLQPQGGGTMTGAATISPGQQLGQTIVTVRVDAAAPGTYVWHVHSGTCGTHGTPVLGDQSAYPPLRVGQDGHASAQVTLGSAQPPAGGNYFLVIHGQGGGEETVYACGNLLEAGV